MRTPIFTFMQTKQLIKFNYANVRITPNGNHSTHPETEAARAPEILDNIGRINHLNMLTFLMCSWANGRVSGEGTEGS